MVINGEVILDIESLEHPAACWWHNALWIAYRMPTSQAVATRVDFTPDLRGIIAPRSLGTTSSDDVAMCVYGGRLFLAGIGPDRQVWLTHSSDGQSFSAPMGSGIFCDAPVALAASGGALFMAWMENVGTLHLARSSDGRNFADNTVSPVTQTPPALASDDDQR